MNVSNRITFGHPKQPQDTNPITRPRRQFQYQNNSEPHQYKEHHVYKSSMQQLSDKVKMVEQRFTKKHMINMMNQVYQSIYQLIFLKETIMSMLNQQKIKMGDFIRDIKKYIFQLQMKMQRSGMERQSRIADNLKQSKIIYEESYQNLHGSKTSIVLARSGQKPVQNNETENVNAQLQRKCEQLTKQNDFLKQQYHNSLSKYQKQIDYLMSNVQGAHKNNQNYLYQQIAYLKQVIEQSNKLLKTQQQKYKEKIQYLQNQIISLEDQYLKEKQTTDRDLMRYREKEKMYMFQETQIQRKNILLIQRQKSLYERENLIKQERNAIQRRENKISDYQHNQMRRDKQQKQIERNNLRNQYYGGTNTNIPTTKHEPNKRIYTASITERERSSSSRNINSGLDIHARLKEIQQQKRKLGFNGIKGSRISEAGHRRPTQNRSFSRDNHYSKPFQQQNRQPVVLQNVGYKLTDMLANLQKDLNDIK